MRLELAAAILFPAAVSGGSQSSFLRRQNPDSVIAPSTTVEDIVASRHLVITNCTGAEDFDFDFAGPCNYENLRDAIAEVTAADFPNCAATADEVALDLLNEDTVEAATTAVADLCKVAYDSTTETFSYADITKKGVQFDNEYYSGGTYFNYEVQTNDGEHELKVDAARIDRIYDDEAKSKVFEFPDYLRAIDPDGDGCDINAAFCCWVQDRQANDNNGNCNTPYDSQCIDKDPGDNANFCYTDHSRSQPATHTLGGFSVFGDVLSGKENIEGPIHCHGLAWGQDELDSSAVYKGNNLFYISLYDHMYQRGYVRNAPGSTMCGCAENMAVVTRADCTEITATETFSFSYTAASSTFSGVLSSVDNIAFNACQGANGNNNDLDAYYERLVNEGRQTQENLDTLRETLVGTEAGQCNAAIEAFMETKGIVRIEEAAALADSPDLGAAPGGNGKKKVELIDPDLLYADGGGANMQMPDVPYDPAMDLPDGLDTTEEPEEGEDDIDEEEPEGETETDAPLKEDGEECAAAEECISEECIDGGDGVFVCGDTGLDGDGTTDPTDPPEPVLKENGEDCAGDDECKSGKCLGNGTCGKVNGNKVKIFS